MVRMDTASGTTDTFAEKDTIYEQESTVHHWQLKDLISCDNEDNLYCVHSQTTKLGFAPNCMTVGYGYIAAGGFNGSLEISSLKDMESVFPGPIGDTVNNSLHITESPLGLVLFVCSNDKTIKMFSLPQMDSLDTLQFPDPINYSATAQDAEYVIAVGDNFITYLYKSTPIGYCELAQMESYQDVGLCCAWDAFGVRFATASQDGLACLGDRRMPKLIAKFKTEGSCKNVKFCPAPMDLLAYTEDRNICHLVDTRKYQDSQILRIDSATEHDISGITFSQNGKKLYVGTTTCGIHSYDINTFERRQFSERSFL